MKGVEGRGEKEEKRGEDQEDVKEGEGINKGVEEGCVKDKRGEKRVRRRETGMNRIVGEERERKEKS